MIMRNLIESFDNQKESIVNISMLKINATDSINSIIFKIITPISTIKQHKLKVINMQIIYFRID